MKDVQLTIELGEFNWKLVLSDGRANSIDSIEDCVFHDYVDDAVDMNVIHGLLSRL